jgi:hypothetical protein
MGIIQPAKGWNCARAWVCSEWSGKCRRTSGDEIVAGLAVTMAIPSATPALP